MRRSCSVVFYHSLTAESRSFLRETTRRFKFAGSSTRFSDRRESISGNIKSQNFVKLPRWWPGLFSSRTKAKCGDAPTLRSLQRKRRNCCKIWAKIAERHIGMRNVYIFRFLLLSAAMWRSSSDRRFRLAKRKKRDARLCWIVSTLTQIRFLARLTSAIDHNHAWQLLRAFCTWFRSPF